MECFAIDQELDEDHPESSKFLLTPEDPERSVDPETQARLEALLEAAGIGKLSSGDGKHLADHEVLRRLTSSVSCALDEAAAALTRMRSDNPRTPNEKRSLVEACTDGDVGTVRKLLTEGRSVHETTEEGESLLSLACSAGYYELAQVWIETIIFSSLLEGSITVVTVVVVECCCAEFKDFTHFEKDTLFKCTCCIILVTWINNFWYTHLIYILQCV